MVNKGKILLELGENAVARSSLSLIVILDDRESFGAGDQKRQSTLDNLYCDNMMVYGPKL